MTLRRASVSVVCLILLGYFVYHLFVGDHGLDARARLESQVTTLKGELNGLKAVRARLERDVSLMRSDQIDPDMLGERARTVLDFAHPRDIVITDKESGRDRAR